MFQSEPGNSRNSTKQLPFVAIAYLFLATITLGLIFEVWITPGYAYNKIAGRRHYQSFDEATPVHSADPYQTLLDQVELPTTPVDTMDLHWSRPADLSEAETREFANKYQEVMAETRDVEQTYRNEYRLQDGKQIHQLKELIATLVADPPDRPDSRELMQRISRRWQKLEQNDRADAQSYDKPPATPSSLVMVEDHLVRNKLTLADVETVELHGEYHKNLQSFAHAQHDELMRLKEDLRSAIRKEEQAAPSYDNYVPAGLPPFNPQDPYQYLDSRYKRAYAEYEKRKNRKEPTLLPSGITVEELLDMQPGDALPPRRWDERGFNRQKAREILDEALYMHNVTRSTIIGAFMDARYAEEVEAVVRDFQQFHNMTGRPEDNRDLKAELLQYARVPNISEYKPGQENDLQRAIDSVFSLPRYWKQ